MRGRGGSGGKGVKCEVAGEESAPKSIIYRDISITTSALRMTRSTDSLAPGHLGVDVVGGGGGGSGPVSWGTG